MKYIKDSTNAVYGFDETDPAQVALMKSLFYTNGALNAGCSDVTGSWPSAPTAADEWAAYRANALAALADTDTTMHRIVEGVALGSTSWTAADVVAFVQYRQSLRAILSEAQPSTIPASLPTKPAYPAGT